MDANKQGGGGKNTNIKVKTLMKEDLDPRGSSIESLSCRGGSREQWSLAISRHESMMVLEIRGQAPESHY